MSMTEDQYYEHCEAHHHEPVDGCISCEARTDTHHCDNCGQSWSGRQLTGHYNPGSGCDHYLRNGFGEGLTCPVYLSSPGSGDGGKCGDPIRTPGFEACDEHQRFIDSVEAGRIYQNMVTR